MSWDSSWNLRDGLDLYRGRKGVLGKGTAGDKARRPGWKEYAWRPLKRQEEEAQAWEWWGGDR